MTFPITIASTNGHFTASVLGSPHLRADGPTREQALALLKSLLADQVRRGELTALDVESPGIKSLMGKYAGDPTLRDICEEAYRSRNEEPAE